MLFSKKINTSDDLNNINNNNTANDKINLKMIGKDIVNNTSNNTINRRISDDYGTKNELLIVKKLKTSDDLNNINNNNTDNDKNNIKMIGKEVINEISNNMIMTESLIKYNIANKSKEIANTIEKSMEKSMVIRFENISRIHQNKNKSEYYDYGTITNIIIDDEKKYILSKFVKQYKSQSENEDNSLLYLSKFKLNSNVKKNE